MYRRSAQAGAPPAAPVAAPAAAPGTTPTSIPGLDLPSPPPGSSAARTEEPSKDVPDVLSNRPAALKERDIPVPAKSKSAKKSKTQDNAPKQ
jgi:hypothetical protein